MNIFKAFTNNVIFFELQLLEYAQEFLTKITSLSSHCKMLQS